MATNATERPVDTGYGDKDKSNADKTGDHPKRGFALWLHRAPRGTSFSAVVDAHSRFETPQDAWGDDDE